MRTGEAFQQHLADALPFLEVRLIADPQNDAQLSAAANTQTQKSIDLLSDGEVPVGVMTIGNCKGLSIRETFERQILLSLLL